MKIGFISLTKTAHSSISQMLPPINNFPNFSEDWLKFGKHQCLKKSGQLEDYEFLFTSVRHPVDRFLSSYKECVRKYGYKKNINQFFEDYLDNKLSVMQLWHTQHQSFHIIEDELDCIVKVENFDSDMKKLCEFLGLPKSDSIWANKSRSKPNIDKSLREDIELCFKPCMDLFNY